MSLQTVSRFLSFNFRLSIDKRKGVQMQTLPLVETYMVTTTEYFLDQYFLYSLKVLLSKRIPRNAVLPNTRRAISGQNSFKISYNPGQPYLQVSLYFLQVVSNGIHGLFCGEFTRASKIIPVATLPNLSL